MTAHSSRTSVLGIAGLKMELERASQILRALSHEHRLTIVGATARAECSVGELERILDLPQPAVSQQLARLRSEGLVTARRDGRTIYYRANVELLTRLFGDLGSIFGPSLVEGAMADSPSAPKLVSVRRTP